MGFCDFKTFNLAMLAKQGWQILTITHTLVSRIFKARYFHDSSFLEANLGNNLSFIWMSIWKAKDVLILRCRWIIGYESKNRVMKEP